MFRGPRFSGEERELEEACTPTSVLCRCLLSGGARWRADFANTLSYATLFMQTASDTVPKKSVVA
jgi:hypothetical protein